MERPSKARSSFTLALAFGGAAAVAVAFDAIAGDCKALGAFVLAGRAGGAGAIAGVVLSSAFLFRDRLGRFARSIAGAAVGLACGIPSGLHLAETATLRETVPPWVLVLLASALMAIAVTCGLVVLARVLRREMSTSALLVGLLAVPALLLARATSDLHAPLAIDAGLVAVTALAAPLSVACRALRLRALLSTTLALLALAVVLTAFPVSVEDCFQVSDRGSIAHVPLAMGRSARLPAFEAPATPCSVQENEAGASLPVAPGRSVVLISVDALRADHLGLAGYGRAVSPFIDALARRAIVFERAYSASPASSFSLPALLSGRFVEAHLRAGADLPKTAAHRLGEAGYRTIALFPPKVFSAGPEIMRRVRETGFGFERTVLLDAMEASADLEAARRAVEEEPGRPVFLWIHLFDPHLPYDCRDAPFGDRPVDCYDAEIRHLDRRLADFLPWLEERLGDPVIALTADHGEAFGEHGRLYHSTDLYEEQIRVPLLLRIPGCDPTRIETPVSNTDLIATVEAVVAGRKEACSSRDLRLPPRAAAMPPVTAAIEARRAVIDGGDKLICNDWPSGACALYDLAVDPGETRNLVGRRPNDAARLRAYLARVEEERIDELGDDAPRAILLGRIGRRDAGPELVALAAKGDRPFSVEAARLLAMLRDEDLDDAIEDLLESKDPEVAAWACVGAVMLDEDCEAGLVAPFAGTDTELGRWAAIALGRLEDPRALPPLVELLGFEEPKLRGEAALALGALRDRRAVPALMALLDVKQTRWAAIDALGEIGDRRAARRLREVRAADPDETNLPRYEKALEEME